MNTTPPQEQALRRSVSLTWITLYGIGVTVGAGIYVLTGEVASAAGTLAPLSFLLASVVAGFSAFCYCELVVRMPRSAGEAVYVFAAFGSQPFATIVGLMVAAAGVLSSAVIILGFAGYLRELIDLPVVVIVPTTVLVLCVIAGWGISQSMWVAGGVTLLEVGGLLLVIGFGVTSDASWSHVLDGATVALSDMPVAVFAVVAGSILAFFAFIGFEDMVNVAEEVRKPEKTMPVAIILTLGISTALYFAVSLVSVAVIPPEELRASEAPLALVFEEASGFSSVPLSAVASVAVLNGALIQIIMASRVFYGMANQGWLPRVFARINPVTRTPVVGTAAIGLIIAGLGVAFPIGVLARYTSFGLLLVFAVVSASLIVLKHRDGDAKVPFQVPQWLPYASVMSSLAIALTGIGIELGLDLG